MSLSPAELLALDSLSYEINNPQYASSGNKTTKLGDIVDGLSHGSDFNMSDKQFDQIKKLVDGDSNLKNLVVSSVHQAGNSTNSAIYLKDPSGGQGYVIFAGTAGDEWDDDVLGAEQADPKHKTDMLDWFDSLDITNPPGVTVSGHSDGANDAMYMTVLRGDKVNSCVEFDGQGFSEAFLLKYQQEIAASRAKITAYNQEHDFVSPLLYPIAGNTVYIGGDYGIIGHAIQQLFGRDADGNLTLSLGPEVAGRDPIMNVLQVFTTGYLDTQIPPVEVYSLAWIVSQLDDGQASITDVIAGLGALPWVPILAAQFVACCAEIDIIGLKDLFTEASDRFGYATRDFRYATMQDLLNLASKSEDKWCDWTDAIGDFFEGCTSWPIVKNLFGKTDAYWGALLDCHNIGRQQLQAIFDSVYALDDQYGASFSGYADVLTGIADQMSDLADSITI
jgi:hypothetical protein